MDHAPPAVMNAARRHLDTLVDPLAWTWVGAPQVRAQLDAWLVEQDGYCRDPKWAARFRRHCPVPGLQDADYAQQWVRVQGAWALVGIRMRGENDAEPFVDLVATSEPLPWSEVMAAARTAYAEFRPLRARIRTLEAPHDPALVTEVDQHFLASPVEAMRHGRCDVALRPLHSAEEGVAYVTATLAAWAEARPWLLERVTPISLCGLRDAAQRGVAAWIHRADDVRVGLIAALPHTDREWSGHAVWEEVVHPDFAGLGYARQAQRALAAQLDGVLFGTIDAHNEPSRRTAEAAGRAIVGAYHWLNAAHEG